ncbi:MAG: penicillin-binding protein 2 [Candidatus Paceibacterota bacterium]
MRQSAVLRIRIITAAVLVLALFLILRLYQVQVIRHDMYVAKAEEQYVHTVQDLFSRGSIYFTNKTGELFSAAMVESGYVLAANPTEVTDSETAYAELNKIIDLDEETFIRRTNMENRTYVVIEEKITEEQSEHISKLDFSGIRLYKNQWRNYPGDSLSGRTIGFIGEKSDAENSNASGLYGLERYYDDTLSRTNDRLSVNFFAEIFSNLGGLVFDTASKRTGDIVTSIEPIVAGMLQQELINTNDTWNSKLTGGIIINPKTGEVIALDAVPAFNLNDRSGATIEDFQNPLVENVYEFGSIMKALTMAAGIDSGAVAPTTTYYDQGFIDLDTYTIRNYDHRGRGTVDMQEVLNQSLNTGAAFIVDTMGKNAFREYFLNLKLGSETGIDLPNEAYGLVDNLNSPREVEYATASFGQGIATTPIAMARALSTLANGGTLITPHLATQIKYEDGTVKDIVFPEGERVFSEETSEEISRMLTNVVDEALRGGTVKLDNYSIAAKTGTAQIADEVNGGYYENKYLHSFFGYFPSYDPEYLIFLYTVEPKNVQYASETLTETFMNITKFLINYYNVPPDR